MRSKPSLLGPAALPLLIAFAFAAPAFAEEAAAPAAAAATCHHALSLVGEPKMPADFKSFGWVNSDAPKGGTIRMSETGSYDSLNPFTIMGSAPGSIGLLFETLFASSPDEPSTAYGLIASCASYPEDFSSVTFKLRPEAKFTDGTPVTVEDVIYSLDALKRANPQMALYYKNVVKAEKTGDNEVTFRFDMKSNRELPTIVAGLNIVPEHYWAGKNAAGEARDITKSSLEIPVGSGPYKVKSMEAGRNLVYERDPNYWAKDLAVTRGQWNFDTIRYEFYRDRTPAFEAFKSGQIDYWAESSSMAWATQYDFPAVKLGAVKKELLPHGRVAGMQDFAFNLRRKQFQDPRVRRAFNLALDFNEMNKKIFFGAYTRLKSYFDNSELASRGLPEGKELEILNTVKDEVPPEVFTTEYKNPEYATPNDLYKGLSEAVKLLQEAGWTLKGGALTNAAGEKLNAEFLLVQPDFERVVLPYIENLKKIGINASARMIDSSQYERRAKSFDFDIIVGGAGQSHSPGNEQRYYFGSAAADREGSRNFGGIKNPAVDKLIDRIVFSKNREELVAATHALDRVLLWNQYVVPQWHYPYERVATWDIFGRPEKLPSENPSDLEAWWMDDAKVKALADKRKKM